MLLKVNAKIELVWAVLEALFFLSPKDRFFELF